MERVAPRRGEIWEIDFGEAVEHEQAGRRPGLVVSHDRLHTIPNNLAVVIPMTTRDRGAPSHVRVEPSGGGVTAPSFVLCEHVRSLSHQRLLRRRGAVDLATLAEVERRLRLLLDLP